MQNKIYRNIAKLLASALPLEDRELGQTVEDYLKAILALPDWEKAALRAAYIFSRKVPFEDREDVFQELALGVLKEKGEGEALAYTIARCDWRDWWQKYQTRKRIKWYSLNAIAQGHDHDGTLADDTGLEYDLGELLVGEAEFERKIDGKLAAEALWAKLPDTIKRVVNRRLLGYSLTSTERSRLATFVNSRPTILVS